MELKGFWVSFLSNRYWVTEMHVDGFRFDLASIMTRGSRLLCNLSDIFFLSLFSFYWRLIFILVFYFPFPWSLWDALNVYGNPAEGDSLTTGTPLSSPPLIDMISNDPILRGVKVFTIGSFLYTSLENPSF